MSTPHNPRSYFSLRGSRNGSLVTVTWAPGALGGDPPTVDLVLAELEIAGACAGDGVYDARLSAILAATSGDPLEDPHAAYALLDRVLDSIKDVDAEPATLAEELRAHRADRPTRT